MDFSKLMDGLGKSGVLPGVAGGLASGAVVGALGTKKGRKAATTVLKVGGIAAAGGLAWKAYQHYKQGGGQRQPEAATQQWEALSERQFHQEQPATEESVGLLIMRSMIAAAMADGHILPQEQNLIFERVGQLDLSESERATLFDELRSPKSPETIAKDVRDPALALELYAAARIVIDADCAAGQAHLNRLARALNIPPELQASIEAQDEVLDESAA